MKRMKLVIVLCAFIGHVYSAPSPCIDLCPQSGDLSTKTSESLQTYRAHSSLSNENVLRDQHQSMINQLQNVHQVNLESTRPGNWTDHNDYVTDNGAGSVHEERGQLVNGASKVNYYKKNYASSYGSGGSDVNNPATTLLSNNHLNTHNTIDRSIIRNHEQPNYYNEQNSHLINHSTGSSLSDNFAHLENFGEQTDTQIHDNSNRGVEDNTGDNWTRHNTYVTDGGRGKVYEEEGQYNHGPAKVRYYKKNYTSSFSTSGGGGGDVAAIPITTISDINTEIDAQMHRIKSQLEQVNSQIDQQTRHLSTNIDNSNFYRDSAGGINGQYDYHTRNHIATNQNVPIGNRVAVTQERHHEKYSSSSHGDHGINKHDNYQQTVPLPSQNQYIAPITHIQSVNTQQVEKHEYAPSSNINSQINSHSRQQQHHQYQHQQRHNGDTTIRIPIYRSNSGIHMNGDSNSYLQNQQLNTNENIYNQHTEHVAIQPQVQRHVEQHWSTSEQRSHSTIPQHIVVGDLERISNGQHLESLGQQQYGGLTHGGYDNVNYAKTNNYIAGSSSSNRKNYGSDIHRGNIHSETVQHGYHGADCDDATQVEYNSQHGQIRYKRNADYSQHNEDLTQQTDESFGKLEHGQQTQNVYNQHHDDSDNLQQTQGYSNHHQTHQHNRFDDYTQQHSENLELDSQQSTHGFEDYTQQHTGNLELGQQHTQQYQDVTQRDHHELGDFTQQQSGNLELDQQHESHSGQLEFGQQTEDRHRHHEQFDQYRHHGSRGHADQDSTQQSTHGFEDYTQQHTGNLESGQQHQSHSGQLEFGQQTEHHNHYYHGSDNRFGNYDMQRQSGSLELSQQQTDKHNYQQQTHGSYYSNHVRQGDQSIIEQSSGNNHSGQQPSDDFTQQTGNIGDFSQQTSGSLEYGQRTRNDDNFSHTNEHNYGLSRPAPKPTPRSQRIGHYERGDTNPSVVGVKGGHRRVPGHQGEFNSHYSQPIEEQGSEGVVSLEQQITKDESINVFQPRILEAYGGNGPYDANHNENIYTDVKSNPSATLAPIVDGKDPWDIREKQDDDYFVKSGQAESIITETSTNLYPDNISTTAAPGFWKRVGQKITNTYEKAKDKVSDVFG